MKNTDENGQIFAGIDFRGDYPKVCYQTEQMGEPQELPLDFGAQTGYAACLRKILSALKRYGRKEDIRAAVVLPDMSEEGILKALKEACEAGFQEGQLQVMGELESLVHFVMHQTNDIWQQQVWVLEFGTDEVKATRIQANKRSIPVVAEAQEPEYWYIGNLLEGERDERLLQHVKERFGKNSNRVSAVFLTGTDLNARDYKKSREAICSRRRVFLGDLLHARGACMLAGDRTEHRQYLYLSEQTLLYNVGIRSSRDGKEEFCTIVSAGLNWYEVRESCEVILCSEPLLEFSFRSMLGGEPVQAGMHLPDLPDRPRGAGRLLVEVHFSAPAQCEIEVTDLGFGELYPSSDLCWKESFILGEQEEMSHGTGYGLQV